MTNVWAKLCSAATAFFHPFTVTLPMLALAWFKPIPCGSTRGRYFCFFYFISSHGGWLDGWLSNWVYGDGTVSRYFEHQKHEGKHDSLLYSGYNCSLQLHLFCISFHCCSLLPPTPPNLAELHSDFFILFFLTSLTNSNQQILKGKFNYNKITSELQIFKAKLQTPSLCSCCRWTPACGFRKGRVSAGSRRHRFFVKNAWVGVGVVLEIAIYSRLKTWVFVLHLHPQHMEHLRHNGDITAYSLLHAQDLKGQFAQNWNITHFLPTTMQMETPVTFSHPRQPSGV